MTCDIASTTASGAITDTLGFLVVVLFGFNTINPDPVENSGVWRVRNKSAKHLLVLILVKLLMFSEKPIRPFISFW